LINVAASPSVELPIVLLVSQLLFGVLLQATTIAEQAVSLQTLATFLELCISAARASIIFPTPNLGSGTLWWVHTCDSIIGSISRAVTLCGLSTTALLASGTRGHILGGSSRARATLIKVTRASSA
jgi:hypothetical protein